MDTLLGRDTKIPAQYSPHVLHKVSRSSSRKAFLENSEAARIIFEMNGFDLWRCYELIWVDKDHIPEACVLEFRYDAQSEFILESKSLKIYLSSLRRRTFEDKQELIETISYDIGSLLKTEIAIRVFEVDNCTQLTRCHGICLDEKKKKNKDYILSELPEKIFYRRCDYIMRSDTNVNVEEILYTNTFQSKCPITEQPDLATVTVHYTGVELDKEAFAIYLNSFADQINFHESCIEQIFVDISTKYTSALLVYGNYTRRGGIEINPYRANYLINDACVNRRARQ
ncbi:hypothetical protein [Candidatus Fokinia crypta]|uniref:NADPH-dependent 7-cyano-7-deazaguanine reductase n=1 Tax=Candidatus Fokinia crypta TaxID=1920990 RepID=A0ABZ0USN6_9RICK|nr:hypothetical protein [Candidatus Fokinia cryptica]WPX97708.1 NADPH-dependent 7-cyano-7-deazaguanine reductase [Candidatus Fokinia cryptica]